MSTGRLQQITAKISRTLSKTYRSIIRRWHGASPGLRYALIYFLSVLVIAFLVWRHFSPTSTLVFDPEASGDSQQQEEYSPPEEQAPPPTLSAFSQGKESLSVPLAGEVLQRFHHPYELGPRYYVIIKGIHIGGTRGDPIRAAYGGEICKVVPPGYEDDGEVWIIHGDFETRYFNLGAIEVKVGDIVQRDQVVGLLGANCRQGHGEDFLEFQIWSDGEDLDPCLFIWPDRDTPAPAERSNPTPGDI